VRPRLIDLYCGVGAAARGYQRAGFHVVCVDIVPQPNCCGDEFIQADALDVLGDLAFMRTFVVAHTSPPCQQRCTLTQGTNQSRGWGREHVQLVPDTRKALDATGLPYVIEQPTGHGGLIRTDLRLCMDMFRSGPPPWVQRHRDFELSGFTVPQPLHPRHEGRVRGMRHGKVFDGPYVAAYGSGGGKATDDEMRHAMGIPWARERTELTEAIPPAYTEYIGKHLMKSVSAGPGLAGAATRGGSTPSAVAPSNVERGTR
jgi:hypothetical protein